jgi:hypothetical protein
MKPILILSNVLDTKAEIKSQNHFDPDALNGFDLDDIPDEGE